MTYHKSVLVTEVLQYLNPQPGKTYLDVTFGGGGHTRAILQAEPNCFVIALDWDQEALALNSPLFEKEFPGRVRFLWGNFAQLYTLLKKEHITSIDGILADFGTSQYQLMQRAGFSFYHDSVLDMRMSPAHQKVTAAEVINKSSEEKLRELFWQFGEERFAKQIARAIVHARAVQEITTTAQLASLIERAAPSRESRVHPATRVFQALRIYVNHELENIQAFLPAAVHALNPGGKLVVISFHSLEDRIAKTFLQRMQDEGKARVLTPRAVQASDEEKKLNPSARSAKLRAIEISAD